MSQSQSQPQSQSQSRENEYGRQGLPPPPPPLQQYPPHLAYAHAGHQQRSGGDESANSNPNPYHHLQHGGGGGGGGANDDRSSPDQGSYSIIPQTRSRPTSPEGLSGSPDRKRYMGMDMNGRDNGENDPALGGQRTTPPDSGLYPGGGAQVDSGGGPVGGGLKNGGTASSKRSKASANLTATTTTIANGTGAGSVSSSGGGQQAPPLKRGNACNICRKRKLKCDGQRPVCGTCARLKHDCQYGDPAQERIAERHRQLEERIRSLEAELATYRNVEPRGGHPQSIPGLTIPHAPSEGAPHPAASGAAAVDPSLYFTAAAILPDPPLLNARGIKSEPSAGSSSANNNDNNSAAAPFPHFPTHELPVEPPFIFPSPVLSDSAVGAAAAAVPEGPTEASARRSASHGNGRRDRGYPASAADLHPSNYVSIPPPPPPHLQSFPFAMNPTPQLSDLVNPTTAASNGGGGGDPSSTRAGAPAPAGYNHAAAAAVAHHPYQGGQQQQQQTPYDAALTPIYGYDLPPLEIMLDLADIYFSTLHLHLPFLHRRRFLYTVHNSASLAAAPSQSLVFAVLAVAAAYHDNPTIRAQSVHWYAKARERVDFAISANVHPLSGNRAATLTVEMVQALCLLALIEMGQSDHQRAFLSLGQAVRIAAMLGLTRMDEDRVADRTGQMVEKRLRPPALHPLPDDAVLLEECRRTMCAVYVLDRFESATVGWPAAIAETDVRVLLPCPDDQFENGRCERDGRNNPLWWPSDGAGTDPAQGWEGVRAEFEAEEQHQGGGNDSYATINNKNGTDRARPHVPTVSTFAWLCRVVWLGSRIQCETYRASGPPPGGPWNRHVEMDPLGSPVESVEMDRVIEYIRSKLSDSVMREARLGGAIDGPKIMALLTLNCMITNLYHLRAASGLSRLPWDPSSPVNEIGSSEFAMQRCWQALHSQYEILSHLTQYENAHTSLHRSRLNAFTAFVPYILYTIAFPAKFAIGDWNVLVQSRDRSENVPAHLARDDLPSGDDAFPPSYFERRLAIVDICCEAMDRIGEVWPVGRKFAAMIRGDRMRLAARTYSRAASAVGQQSSGAPSSSPLNSSQNGYGHAAQQPQA